jgi:hypothetical protein
MSVYKVLVTQEITRTLEVVVEADDANDAELRAEEKAAEAIPEEWVLDVKHSEYDVEKAEDGEEAEDDG